MSRQQRGEIVAIGHFGQTGEHVAQIGERILAVTAARDDERVNDRRTLTELVEDGAKRDCRGRSRLPRERREELLGEYDRSGLSQAGFARRIGVRYSTFAHGVQESRRALRSPASPAMNKGAWRFVELRLPADDSAANPPTMAPLSVTLPDGVVVRGAEPLAMAALVRALREV